MDIPKVPCMDQGVKNSRVKLEIDHKNKLVSTMVKREVGNVGMPVKDLTELLQIWLFCNVKISHILH